MFFYWVTVHVFHYPLRYTYVCPLLRRHSNPPPESSGPPAMSGLLVVCILPFKICAADRIHLLVRIMPLPTESNALDGLSNLCGIIVIMLILKKPRFDCAHHDLAFEICLSVLFRCNSLAFTENVSLAQVEAASSVNRTLIEII